ncbi:TPA: hypothetical protein ACH3X2_000791 [Trebouxia sp. C0005]
MRHRRRARSPPGLTQEEDVDRAQRRRLAAENRAARHANRENGQPAWTNQAPADDPNRDDGQPARKQGGSEGPAAPSEQVHPPQQRKQRFGVQTEATCFAPDRQILPAVLQPFLLLALRLLHRRLPIQLLLRPLLLKQLSHRQLRLQLLKLAMAAILQVFASEVLFITKLAASYLRMAQHINMAINPYAAKYKSAAEAAAGVVKLDLIIRANTGDVDMRRYNAPAANTVAALLPGKPTPDPLDVLPS